MTKQSSKCVWYRKEKNLLKPAMYKNFYSHLKDFLSPSLTDMYIHTYILYLYLGLVFKPLILFSGRKSWFSYYMVEFPNVIFQKEIFGSTYFFKATDWLK